MKQNLQTDKPTNGKIRLIMITTLIILVIFSFIMILKRKFSTSHSIRDNYEEVET